MKPPYVPRKDKPVSPRIARLAEQGLALSEKTQDWLSGGYSASPWDDEIRGELFSGFPILPLMALQGYLEKVRRLMDNVLNHADFTGNQKLHEEVEHTWQTLQEEVDELAMHLYVATFEFDPSNAFKGALKAVAILHKFRVLLPDEAESLSKLGDNIQNYLNAVHPQPD